MWAGTAQLTRPNSAPKVVGPMSAQQFTLLLWVWAGPGPDIKAGPESAWPTKTIKVGPEPAWPRERGTHH